MALRHWPLGIAILVGCRAAAPASTALTPAHRAAITDSVTAALEQFRSVFSARDFAGALRYYSDDPGFRWVEDGEVRYGSKGAVAAALHAFAPSVRSIELAYFDPVVTPLAPGVAGIVTRFVQKFTDTTGTTRGFAGAMTMTMVHADSGWRFLTGHTSSLVPPARK